MKAIETLSIAATVCAVITTASAMTLFFQLCWLSSENRMGNKDTYTGYTISATILIFFLSGADMFYYL